MAMMNMNTPKIGVLLFSNNGLRLSGKDTPDGTYESRMLKLEGRVLDGLKQFANLIYTGIVYTRSDLDRAMEAFQAEKAEGVFALYLSWAPDANWIRFQRDMPAMPVLFASMIPENIPFETTFSANDSVAAAATRSIAMEERTEAASLSMSTSSITAYLSVSCFNAAWTSLSGMLSISLRTAEAARTFTSGPTC